jgi:hypothetical protein
MQISENVRAMINQDGAVLLDIDKGQMIGLNISASRIWEKLQCHLPFDEIVTDLSEEFGIARDLAMRDVRDFLLILQKHALVSATTN